jgi:hypothetical protein
MISRYIVRVPLNQKKRRGRVQFDDFWACAKVESSKATQSYNVAGLKK